MRDRIQDDTPEPVVPAGESETLLSAPALGPYAPPAPGTAIRTPRGRSPRSNIFERIFEGRSRPYLRLAAYYAVLITVMALLVYFVPAVRNALMAPTLLPPRDGGLMSAGPVGDY